MDEQKGKRSIWQVVKEDGGFFFGLVGFFWWLGITPDKVGEFVYNISYIATPFVMFGCGVWIGWSLHQKKMEKDRITAAHIAELENDKDRLEAENKELSDRLNPILQQERKAAETEALIRKKIARLNTDEKKALYWAYEEPGMVPEPASTIWYDFRHLTEMGLMIRKQIDPFNRGLCEWFIAAEVEELLQKDDDLRRSLKE